MNEPLPPPPKIKWFFKSVTHGYDRSSRQLYRRAQVAGWHKDRYAEELAKIESRMCILNFVYFELWVLVILGVVGLWL
jgi:hypothetical protein